MDTDTELMEKKKEHRRARRRYLGYRWFTYGLYFCVFMAIALLFGSQLPDGDWSRAIAVGLLVATTMFLAEWIAALVFKRKFRPWHWGQRPNDENPWT